MPKFDDNIKISASYGDNLDSLQIDEFDTSITVSDSAIYLNDVSAIAQMTISVAVDYDSKIAEYTYDISVHCDNYGDYEMCEIECVDYPRAEISLDDSHDYQTIISDAGFVNHAATSSNIAKLITSNLNTSAYIVITYEN